MSGIGVNLRVTGHCSQGGRKYMEDKFSVAYQQTVDLKDLEYAFFGIFDGHGGPQAASYAKEHLLDSIVNQRNFWSNDDEDILRAIREGYLATHYAMWKDIDKWPKTTTGLPSTSGCTATVAFIMKGKIYIGHVGDTAIVLGYQDDGMKEWKAKVLTKDHKPESKEEKYRIEQSGGKVVNKSGVPRVVWNRPRLGHQGPVRRSTPIDEIPFLAVARSLGDFWSYNSALDQFVVSPEPDVFVYPVDVVRYRCLVLGTDGLWNMMTPERAVTIVQATEIHNEKQVIYGLNNQYNKDWINPSKTLVDRALERWVSTKLRADNTSVVTLLLDPPGPPRAQVLLNQINKWRGESSSPQEESSISVPKSGGLAIFTHYPSSEDCEDEPKKEDISYNTETDTNSVHVEGKYKYSSNPDLSNSQKEVKEMKIKVEPLSAKKIGGDCSGSGGLETSKHTSTTPSRTRSEERSCVEETSSDTENEGVFPESETKKRRMSLDKKNCKPGLCRRPSLPALSGKSSSLCKVRSFEESTRMLRSATPIKTLRSRNIDLSDLSTNSTSKRSRAPSPLLAKKQRIDDQRSTPSPILGKRKQQSKTEDTESTKTSSGRTSFSKVVKSSYLEPENSSERFYDSKTPVLGSVPLSVSDKQDIEDVSGIAKKLLKERKHKSISSPVMSKWQPSSSVRNRDSSDGFRSKSVSDSELSPLLSSFVPNSKRLRFQEDCNSSNCLLSKRKSKTSILTKGPVSSRSSVDRFLDSTNEVSKSVQK